MPHQRNDRLPAKEAADDYDRSEKRNRQASFASRRQKGTSGKSKLFINARPGCVCMILINQSCEFSLLRKNRETAPLAHRPRDDVIVGTYQVGTSGAHCQVSLSLTHRSLEERGD